MGIDTGPDLQGQQSGTVLVDLEYDLELGVGEQKPTANQIAHIASTPLKGPLGRLPDPETGVTSRDTASSKFSSGRNVHDATIVFISLRPLTAALKRFVWQSLYAVIASFFIWTAIRSCMKLGWLMPPSFMGRWEGHHLACRPAEIVTAVFMGQMGICIFIAILLARLHYPEYGIKLIGMSELMLSLLCVVATLLEGLACGEPLRGVLYYGIWVPQMFAVAYVFLRDECKWHRVLFLAGLANVVLGTIMSHVYGVLYYNVLGSGAAGLSYCVFSFIWHKFLLLRALRALRPFKIQQDEAWQPIADQQKEDLLELAALVKSHTNRKQLQPICDFKALMRTAQDINEWYQDVVRHWAEELKVMHKAAPLKKQGRVLEKIERSYHGDVRKVLDLVRASIIVDTVREARQALDLVLKEADVFVLKCRYDLAYDGKATNGYRDMNLQLSFRQLEGTQFDGFVFELQIILADFFKIKSEGQHAKYIECRNLRGD